MKTISVFDEPKYLREIESCIIECVRSSTKERELHEQQAREHPDPRVRLLTRIALMRADGPLLLQENLSFQNN